MHGFCSRDLTDVESEIGCLNQLVLYEPIESILGVEHYQNGGKMLPFGPISDEKDVGEPTET